MAAVLLNVRPLFRWIFKDVKLPSYLTKVTSWSWPRSYKSNSQNLGGIHRENHIELQFSDASALTNVPDPLTGETMKVFNGSQTLDNRSEGDLGLGRPVTETNSRTSSQDGPWHNSSLR